MLRAVLIALIALASSLPQATAVADEEKEPKGPFRSLTWRLIGPAAGGRVSRVAGVPGDPRTAWAATSAGGVWKTVNGGTEWKPVFDDQPVSSIGSLAIAPSDPNVVWVGAGEANIRGNVGEGNGIYRTTDAGKTWSHVWTAEGQIGTIAVDPRDPDVAFAAVLGSPFGPGKERGILRTMDGGRTWTKVLYVDADTGASDVCLDPANPRILFAGTWQVRRTPWSLTSGGPGGGLWRSGDRGETWKRLTGGGLPAGIWGKVGVGVAAADPRRVYALIEAEEGGLFRSDDGGANWTRVNPSRGLRQRAWYYSTLTIDPGNADVVWFPQVNLLKTVDGGASVRSVQGGGWDYHDVWIDPADPSRILIGSDAGVSLSRDGGATWVRPALPISQFYHVSVDSRDPYRVLGSLQDLGTVSGPSRVFDAATIMLSEWHPVGGGEAGWVVADPQDPGVVWAGEYMGFLSRYDGRTRRAPHVGIYPDNGSGHGAADMRYRFQWTAPIAISPHDSRVVYHAGNVLFRTENGGQTWRAISPDLTRDDPSRQQWSGGPITGDNTGVEYYGTIFAVAESPLERDVIWAGSDDGLVHLTRDGGEHWTDVTPRGFPAWGTVAGIEASRRDAGTAYVVVDAHRLDDETPYLWGTTDYGASWKRLGRDLDPEIYLHVVREDPRRPGLLYLGTERGVMLSRDGGGWESLQLNMPTVAIADLVVAGDDLVAGSLGRSAWILDDLTAVRDLSDEIAARPVHLFPPLPAVDRSHAGRWSGRLGSRQGGGDNPPAGALLTYWLAAKPSEPIKLEILDGEGRVARTLSSELEPAYTPPDHPDWDPQEERKPDLTVKPGLNRASWDLEYERARWVAGTRNEAGGRGAGPRALPGEYTLRLLVGSAQSTRTLRVQPDPASTASPADREAQFAFGLELRDRMSRVADLIVAIRSIRDQITAHRARLAARSEASGLLALGDRIVAALHAIEAELCIPGAEVDYDVLAGRTGGAKIISRLGWLAGGALDHEGPPTQGMREVAAEIAAALAQQEHALDRLLAHDLAELNAQAAGLGLPFVLGRMP
jgi:photosystem II stability/assembly factor-like uncharacterized protein